MGNNPDNKTFEDQLGAARKRSSELKERASAMPSQDTQLVAEIVEQLQVSLEELQVAEQELRQQNDELLSARDQIESERERYLSLFEFAPDAYLSTTQEGVILEANRAAAVMFGLSQKLLVGKLLLSFIDAEHRQSFRTELNRISQTGRERKGEIEMLLRPRNQQPFNAALTVATIHNRPTNTISLRWLVRDITERKQAEEQIRSMNAELERRVAERTAELEAANRSKDEFFAALSHELRTPLNAILGWVHILRAQLDSQTDIARAVDVIERNALAQSRIINDLLEVSHIIAGNLRLDLKVVNLLSVLEAVIDAARPAINEKSIRLETALDQSVGSVRGDPNRLQQVVSNILLNAIKFTPANGIIKVTLERVNNDARIIVSDTGKGITPEFLPFVFDRFRQADSTGTRTHGGLGLGLAIARHLADVHGGTIQAMSEGEGRGTTVVVTLPLVIEDAARQTPSAGGNSTNEIETDEIEQASAPDSGVTSLGGLGVLVVDDEPDAREMLRVVLTDAGAKVTTAGSCAETLAVLTGEATGGRRPDVLVADISMPDQDGFDLIRALRQLEPERGGAIPAIALTAYAGDEDRLRMLSEGYQMHLAKPVKLDDLVAAVAKLGNHSRKRQQSAPFNKSF